MAETTTGGTITSAADFQKHDEWNNNKAIVENKIDFKESLLSGYGGSAMATGTGKQN